MWGWGGGFWLDGVYVLNYIVEFNFYLFITSIHG